MPYQIGWVVPQRVYMIVSIGEVSTEELKEASDKAIELVRNGNPPVHCIGDTRQLTRIPFHMLQPKNALNTLKIMQEPNLGWFLMVTDKRAIALASAFISDISNVKFKAFFSPDKVLEALAEKDPTLPELPKQLRILEEIY